jgi:two-component system NarL family response regulator
MSPQGTVTVVIVDDHPVVRDGLQAILSTEAGLSVVAETGDGAEALEIIPKLRPHVVLMDLMLPGISGIEVIRRVGERYSDINFIVLTSVAGDEEIYRALEAGARGYLFKDMARKELIRAVWAVHKGQRYIPNQVGSRIAEFLPRSPLSPREIDVLQCISGGMRNKEIAEQLGLSEFTVNSHVKRLMEKLNVNDRTLAVTMALKRGIIHL